MSVFKKKLSLTSHGRTPTFINITEELRTAIRESGIREGIATVISPHTTCAVFFEELVHDAMSSSKTIWTLCSKRSYRTRQAGTNTSIPERSTIAPLKAGRMLRLIFQAATALPSGTVMHILRRPSSAHRRHSKYQTANSESARRATAILSTSTAHVHAHANARLS